MIESLKAYDSVIRAMHRTIKGLKAYPVLLAEPEHTYLHKFFDKALFNALCNLDLITELKYLDVSNAVGNMFEANFFARITAHSCFEILDNLNETVGREIIELVKARSGAEALSDLNAHVQKLNQVKKRHLDELKRIRNYLFGHRMKAGREQAEQMLRINPRSIYNVGQQIYRIELDILGAFVNILKKI
jgi:hypothetical protein